MQSIGNLSIIPADRQVSSAFSRTEQETDVSRFINHLNKTEKSASTFGDARIWVSDFGDKMFIRFKAINSTNDLPDFSVRIKENKPVQFITANNDYNTLSPDNLIGIPQDLIDYISSSIKPNQDASQMALSSQLRALVLDPAVAEQPPSAPVTEINQLDPLPPLTRCEQVVLWGLETSPHLNGCHGVVIGDQKDGRVPVKITYSDDTTTVRPRRSKLIPIKIDPTLKNPVAHEIETARIKRERDAYLTPTIENQVGKYLSRALNRETVYNVSGALDPFELQGKIVIQTHPCVVTARRQSKEIGKPVLPFTIRDISNAVTSGQLDNGDVVLTNILTAVKDIKSIASDAAKIAGTNYCVVVLRDSNYCRRFLVDEMKRLNQASPDDPYHVVLPYAREGGDPFVIFVQKSVTDDEKRISKLRIRLEEKFDKSICNQFFDALFLNPTFDSYNGLYEHPNMVDVISFIVKVLKLKDDEVHTININKFKGREISDAFKAHGFLEKDCQRFQDHGSPYKVNVTIFNKSPN